MAILSVSLSMTGMGFAVLFYKHYRTAVKLFYLDKERIVTKAEKYLNENGYLTNNRIKV